MKISQSNSISFQSRKVPRFIYHLTNQHAYAEMCKDGFIRCSEKDPYLEHPGVFAIELRNFLKHWKHNKDWDETAELLQESVFRNAARWIKSFNEAKNRLVILKIPTDSLNPEKLKIRSQNEFFRFKMNKTKKSYPNEHLRGYTPANKSRLYKNRKEAIEYIYQDPIPIELVTPIGNSVDIPLLRKSVDFDSDNPPKSILTHLLDGTPESKALRDM